MEEKIEHHDTPRPSGIGATLKAAREAAGLGLGEVADRLKLSLRQLEAIERDDFDSLPGATFVRGFVRNYARFLEVDSEPLMKALEQHFPSAVNDVANLVKGTTAREQAPEPVEAVEEAAEAGAGKWVVLLLLGLAVAGGAYWYANRDGSPEKPAERSANELAPMLTEQSSAPAAKAAASESAKAAVQVAKPASAPAAVAAKPVASAAQAAAKPAASAPAKVAKTQAASAPQSQGADKVSINVKDAAWVSVQDADGRRLIYKVMQPGDPAEVVGTAPFKVVIGNASQVELSYNGKPVDLADKIKGTTAKIQLK
ncbi:XRE family transcriptional regulator [Chromobacterium vaccinii]|uniref:RodZ domain-containing protein n=1 Tax=Chromobacterium vaccinii TaxID=1108595 RepID=UPI000CE974F4|nr:RodZ domain-containing protein [Chromobacterium vaccinii]AVG18361.1 XRE family transcriptional regulator [Chromobacterium vaccinii]